MTMRKHILISLAVIPLLLSFCNASQNSSVDPPLPYGYSSEESGTGSYLGVDISDITTERLSALKLKEEKGVEVTMVDQDAPAGKAGIKEHDVILGMNGTAIESQVQLKRMIRETPPGRLVTFQISRDGQPMTIKLQLADRRRQYGWVGPNMKDFHVEIPAINLPNIEVPQINVMVVRSSARSGLMVENITAQLGEFFGVKNGNGVLIRAVEKGSRGEKAGFRAGDVIVKINDQPVHDTSDFTEVMHSRDAGSVSVSVIRDRKEQNLNLELPPHKESGTLIEDESFDDAPVINADEDDLEMSEAQDEDELAALEPEMAMVSEDSEPQTQEAEDALLQARCAAQQEEKAKELTERFPAESEALRAKIDSMRQDREKRLRPQMQEKMKREQKTMQHEHQRLRIEMERRLRQGMGGFDI
ncbi:MAG TPA: PDZ domain-containing protein [Candidatus Sulfotelmatobacter sp.]